MDSGRPGGSTTTAAEAADADLAGALHEVSNALTVILGWIERARAEDEDRRPQRRALEIAESRARQARDVVRRAIGAEVAAEPPRGLGSLVDEAVTGVEPEARRAGVRLVSTLDAAADGRVLEGGAAVVQILTNLLLNAIALSPPATPVRVDARHDPERAEVRIGVSDEGPGVPPERRAGILDSGLSTRAGGAGIGLRHAAAMARAGGGELRLAESAVGARFELRWPGGDDGSTAPTSRVTSVSNALHGRRILVVEDDGAVIELLELALSARGADVVSVKNRAALAGAVDTGVFDAALFDISPIRDDFAGALGSVRAKSPSARLIVMSGSAVALPAVPPGCEASWVRKPFEIDEIVRALADD
ncbi:MAG: ATP-binding protein [Polyangiaceae bacterium]